MNDRRVSTEKLAKKAGVNKQLIDDLIQGRLAPEKAKEEVFKLGQIIIGSPDAEARMKVVMQALDVHVDLRNWSGGCDGGCCPWGIATEIALDEAIPRT